jgi:hypothetical protein
MSVAIAIASTPSMSSTAGNDSLIRLCQQKMWHAVAELTRSNPSAVKAASATDVKSNKAVTPLHIACESGAPIQIIKLILSAHPPAAQIIGGLYDRLPLHCLLAATTIPSESIVAALIEAFPGACRVTDKNGNLPIHLACQAAHVSDAIFTSILSMYPEGAYARNTSGQYPLHIAAANKDTPTKKVALAALDRGTLYASISKMTSIRLAREHEDQTRLLNKKNADKVATMEAHALEERSKLKAQIESLQNQLKTEKEIISKLQVDMKNMDVKHNEEISRAVLKEQAKASCMEKQLRSELAVVQLKNMDFLDQVEMLQADNELSNKKVDNQAHAINELEQKNMNSNNLLAETLASLESTKKELTTTEDQLESVQIINKEKSKRILQLEDSLRGARETIFTFRNEKELLTTLMTSQKEKLVGLLMGHDSVMNDTGALVDKMVMLADNLSV